MKKQLALIVLSLIINILIGIVIFGILKSVTIVTGTGEPITTTQNLLLVVITISIMIFIQIWSTSNNN